MPRQFGLRNASRDARTIHVMQRQDSVLTRSALDTWDALVTLHYGGRAGIAAHFREASIAESGLRWALAAPFGPPASEALDNSILAASTQDRAFAYQYMAASNHYDKLASVALVTSSLDDYIGIRLDDGTDNNYLEVVLRCSQTNPTLWCIRTRRRAGGGAVTTQDSDDLHTDPGCVLRMDLSFAGNDWENNWTGKPVLHTNMGFEGWMFKPNTVLAANAFIPTRAGVIFASGAPGESYMYAKADWFDIGRA